MPLATSHPAPRALGPLRASLAAGGAAGAGRGSHHSPGGSPCPPRALQTANQVVLGKPAPEIFEAACARLGADPARTLVFEDALSGVQGARAAGCSVVAVPSHQLGPSELASLAGERTTVLRSLLDCDLGTFGLPPFTDWVRGSLPLADPLRFRGEVIRGFGRGSQVLGIPTANLDASKLGVGAAHACGIYLGWASVGASSAVHKMVMSIGWNPFFKDQTHKTVEPWILHSFDGDFYGARAPSVAEESACAGGGVHLLQLLISPPRVLRPDRLPQGKS